MGEHVIPDRLQLAAKRAAVRTVSAGYAASIPTGLTAGSVLAVIDHLDAKTAAVTAAAAIVQPLLAGARAYFRMLANGLPDEYAAAASTPTRDDQEA